MGEETEKRHPAGFRTSGPPSSLSVTRTLRRSLSRRIALGRPSAEDLAVIAGEVAAAEAEGLDPARIASLKADLERQARRSRTIPFIDPVDLRYRRTEARPEPIARAVMFCVMDVSSSMDEHMKDLAKRFFSLLYLFLTRRYRRVEIVFIRHTHEAREVDEETFFHSREAGGTVISSALELAAEIMRERYPPSEWNIYAAQASDGDNMSTDNARAVALLDTVLLPQVQHYAYLEVGRPDGLSPNVYAPQRTTLWSAYEGLVRPGRSMAMRRVSNRRDIYPVFRDLFERRPEAADAE
jgi:uncharacterized sporulation protein YeaH/YhbH (DUF444 family)